MPVIVASTVDVVLETALEMVLIVVEGLPLYIFAS